MKNNLTPKHKKALEKFTEQQKKNPEVIGILLSGSFIHSKPDKNSDLDIFVITKNSKFRERGNIWIDGVEVEYFNNPVKQIRHYFKKEIKGETSPSTAHMFANSVILYNKDPEINTLIKEAKKILKKPNKNMTRFEIEHARYFIDDLGKDLEDMYIKKDNFSFEIISLKILKDCLDIFYKTKRLYPEKSKRLLLNLKKIDKEFANIYKNALLEKDTKKKYAKLKILIKYVEKILGGKRPKEWKLKSRCEI
jgi:predicted nucleotidyltransferase